jgi:surface protein
MFDECTNLKEITIDPNIFKTKETISMGHMFNKCYTLDNINLSSFTDDKIEFTCGMFSECHNLKKIDLPNFGTKGHMNNKVKMQNMFNECTVLEKIDLSSFIVTDDDEMKDMFEGSNKITEIKVNKNCIEKFKTKFNSIKTVFIN